MKSGSRILASAVAIAFAALAMHPGLVAAGCSDSDFLKSFDLYEQAMKNDSAEKKIKLLELAFDTCPSHGRYAQGYYLLGEMYYDRGNKEKAFEWLVEANRFRSVMLQRSLKDVAQTNLLLGKLYREKGEAENALIHLNIYRALTMASKRKVKEDFIETAEALSSVIFSPGSVKQTLRSDEAIPSEQKSLLSGLEVYFDFGSAFLTDTAKKRLDVIGRALKDEGFNGCSIVAEGHTDQQGSDQYNRWLGQKRARAVAQYLRNQCGITHLKLVPASCGETRPAIARQGHGRNQWHRIDRLNRRVVVWNQGRGDAAEKKVSTQGSLTVCH